MNKYFLQYNRDMERTISYHLEDVEDELNVQFKLMVESLDLDRNGYTVSYCCDLLNEKFNYKIQNRHVKSLLIDYYGKNISFNYPRDGKKSQMFFSTNICQVDVVQSLRNKSSNTDIISCIKTLQSNIKLFKFPLEESIFDATHVATCQSNIVVPDSWHIFMKHLCDKRSNSDDFDRQGFVIFQLIYCFLQNGIKKIPLYVSIVQSIHNEC